MSTIVIIDDDSLVRTLVRRILTAEGHVVLDAADGATGLKVVQARIPDLVISDINMPGFDGYELLAMLRMDKTTATLPVILLTQRDDRDSFRRGMQLGADDYLPKPFTRAELLSAVDARLQRIRKVEEVIEDRVHANEEQLRHNFASQLAGAPAVEATAAAVQAAERTVTPVLNGAPELISQGFALNAGVVHFTDIAAKLTGTELSEVLLKFFEDALTPLMALGAQHVQFLGEGLTAVFRAEQCPYALNAALELAAIGKATSSSFESLFFDRGLKPLRITVGLASGDLLLSGKGSEARIRGIAARRAIAVRQRADDLGWQVAALAESLSQTHDSVQIGEKDQLLANAGSHPVVQIMGLHAHATIDIVLEQQANNTLHGELRENAQLTARAVKRAFSDNLRAIHAAGEQGAPQGLVFKNYRIDKRIGAGGISQVFLAYRAKAPEEPADTPLEPIVLKVLDMRSQHKRDQLPRFVREYAMLSKIDHPNVVRIFDEGIAEDHAYIAMEYFERGDLRNVLRPHGQMNAPSMGRERSLAVVMQIAQALVAIHDVGIIHRDVKPENIMVRADGSIALADFGIAKDEESTTLTHHEHIIGTPYYLSPEQASTGQITLKSDLYSLGVILYECLAGARPYRGTSLAAVIGMHLSAPIPDLPPEFFDLQPLLDKLMAKKPSERFDNARQVLQAVHQLQATLPKVTVTGNSVL